MLQRTDPPVMACPACGTATAQRFLYAKNGCDILRCTACGIGRTETRGFDPASYYTGDYFSGQHADGYGDYLGAETVLRREFAHTAAFIRSRFSRGKLPGEDLPREDLSREDLPGGRLLEIGCAYGFFLQEAARAGFEPHGIELAAEAAEHARSRGLNVTTGVADEVTLAALGTFDVIVLLDVIEHLPDPRATLTLAERHLNPGGIIVLTTGDFGSLAARLTGASWRLMTPPQHLWFFSHESMRRLASSLGLALETYDHPWKVVPLSLIVFQIRRMLGFRPRSSPMATGAGGVGLPLNLFDAMRVVLRKPGGAR